VLSESGVVGELISHSPLKMGHLGRVHYIGVVCRDRGETLKIRQFGVTNCGGTDCNAPVYLIIGTSSSVGKTTAQSVVPPAARGVAVYVALDNAGGKQRVRLKVEMELQVR